MTKHRAGQYIRSDVIRDSTNRAVRARITAARSARWANAPIAP